jgi:hypothetical protein
VTRSAEETKTDPVVRDPNVEATLELLRTVAEHAVDEEAEIVAAALDLLPQVAGVVAPGTAVDRELRRALPD